MSEREPMTPIPAVTMRGPEHTSRPTAVATDSNMDVAPGSLAERLRTAEAAMRHSARLAMVGQMTAILIHEVSNPVSSIQSALHLLTRLPPDHPHYAHIIELLRDELSHLSAITARMRDLYRPGAAEPAECDLGSLLTHTLTLAELRLRGTHVSVAFIPPPTPVIVIANIVRLRQLFLNLIVNAIDAMPTGGVLTVRLLPQAATVVVEIQDTGGGIPPDILSRLFEPFVTSKASGSGLGLYISAQIIVEHGGWIELQSVEGHGSMFRVVLPSSSHRE